MQKKRQLNSVFVAIVLFLIGLLATGHQQKVESKPWEGRWILSHFTSPGGNILPRFKGIHHNYADGTFNGHLIFPGRLDLDANQETLEELKNVFSTYRAGFGPYSVDENAASDKKAFNWTAESLKVSMKEKLTNPYSELQAEPGSRILEVSGMFTCSRNKEISVQLSEIGLMAEIIVEERTTMSGTWEIIGIGTLGDDGQCTAYFFPKSAYMVKGFLTPAGNGYKIGREKEEDPMIIVPENNPIRFCLAFGVPQGRIIKLKLHFGEAEFDLPLPAL